MIRWPWHRKDRGSLWSKDHYIEVTGFAFDVRAGGAVVTRVGRIDIESRAHAGRSGIKIQGCDFVFPDDLSVHADPTGVPPWWAAAHIWSAVTPLVLERLIVATPVPADTGEGR